MTRSSHSGTLKFDLEIEKNFHKLRRGVRQTSENSSSIIHLAIDSSRISSSVSSDTEIEVMAINPDNNRTLKELAAPNLNQQPLISSFLILMCF